jgi:hypothetical protein
VAVLLRTAPTFDEMTDGPATIIALSQEYTLTPVVRLIDRAVTTGSTVYLRTASGETVLIDPEAMGAIAVREETS